MKKQFLLIFLVASFYLLSENVNATNYYIGVDSTGGPIPTNHCPTFASSSNIVILNGFSYIGCETTQPSNSFLDTTRADCPSGSSCYYCASGYKWDGSSCVPYDPNACFNSGDYVVTSSSANSYAGCLTVPPTPYYSQVDFTRSCSTGQECRACNPGFKWDGSRCVTYCPNDPGGDFRFTFGGYEYAGCFTSQSQPLYSIADSSKKCTAGGTTCYWCANGAWDGIACPGCPAGYTWDATLNSCRLNCPANFVWNTDLQKCVYQLPECSNVEGSPRVCNYRDTGIPPYAGPTNLCIVYGPQNPPLNTYPLPYEQACCYDTAFNGNDYYKYTDVVVLKA